MTTICAWCFPGSGDNRTSHGCCLFHRLELFKKHNLATPAELTLLFFLRMWRGAVAAWSQIRPERRYRGIFAIEEFDARAVVAAQVVDVVIPAIVLVSALVIGFTYGAEWIAKGCPYKPDYVVDLPKPRQPDPLRGERAGNAARPRQEGPGSARASAADLVLNARMREAATRAGRLSPCGKAERPVNAADQVGATPTQHPDPADWPSLPGARAGRRTIPGRRLGVDARTISTDRSVE